MARPREKPPYLEYLALKGIRAGGCFRFRSEPERLLRLTRGDRLLDLAGEPVELTENDLWERLEELQVVPKAEFDEAQRRYRDRLWRQKGQPTGAELEPLAQAFAREYALHYAEGRWKEIGRYDEETMRRILRRAAALLSDGQAVGGRARRARFSALFQDAVRARNEAFFRRRGDDGSVS